MFGNDKFENINQTASRNNNNNSNNVNDTKTFMNNSLFLSPTLSYPTSTNSVMANNSVERIPSIKTLTSNPGTYSDFNSSYQNHAVSGNQGNSVPNYNHNQSYPEFNKLEHDKGILNTYARPDGYPTLGQIADQFQERARSDGKSKTMSYSNSATPAATLPVAQSSGHSAHSSTYGDDYDDEDDAEHPIIPQGTESTGRWTRQEHDLFLEALKKYGKEWKKVASMVKTRTVVQTRTHAQKYFQKVTKNTGGQGQGGGGGTTDDDDDYPAANTGAAVGPLVEILALGSDKKGVPSSGGVKGRPRRVPALSSPSDHFASPVASSSDGYHYGSTPAGGAYNDHRFSAQEYSIDQDSLDRDSLVLQELMFMASPPAVASEPPQQQLASTMPPPPPFLVLPGRESLGFPQPSPAACGKRKHAELQAAQMLASSSTFERDGPETHALLKDESGRKRPAGLTLSISNPDSSGNLLLDGGPSSGVMRTTSGSFSLPDGTPGTPWARELRALEARVARASQQQATMPVSTPSEQRNFLSKVRALVQAADIPGIRDIFHAAEFSAQSFLSSGNTAGFGTAPSGAHAGFGFGGAAGSLMSSSTSVSNLMSVYSSAPPTVAPQPSSPRPSSTSIDWTASAGLSSSTATTFRKTPGTSLVARSLNRSDKREKSVLMEALSLNEAQHGQATALEICSLLVEHGSSASITDAKGNTALHFAAERGYETVGRLLINKGCPVSAQNAEGDAATHIAAKKDHGPFLEMLVDMGANFHLRNNASAGALDLAGFESKDPGERAVIRRLMLAKEPRLRTLILYHADCLEHSARRPSDWEGPDRLTGIMRRLRDRKEFPEFELEISDQFEKASVALLSRIHSPEYLSFVNGLSAQLNEGSAGGSEGNRSLRDPLPFTPQIQKFVLNKGQEELKSADACDTSFSAGTLTAARRAAGAVAHAVDCVLLGRNRNVFCVVRPPGHHAGYNGLLDGGYSCGFCIFNNVAAGALHALEEHNCERVAIVDLDIHHGNGTEDIVRRYPQPSRLFFFSLHLYDKEAPEKVGPSAPGYQFYPGSGASDDTIHNIINVPIPPLWKDEEGDAAELGSTSSASVGLNASALSPSAPSPFSPDIVPLSDSTIKSEKQKGKTLNLATLYGREAYRQAILQRLVPSLRAFNPDLILLSSGFDAANGDVGNCRNYPGLPCQKGMDLSPEDFGWAVAEIMKVADLCCAGKVVSVLEGGYGQYGDAKAGGRNKAPATRLGTRQSGNVTADKFAQEEGGGGVMNRDLLSAAAVAHLQRLIDPYGPSRLPSAAAAGIVNDGDGKR